MASQYEIMAPSTESGERYDSTENGQYVAEAVADDEDDRNMDEIAQVWCLLPVPKSELLTQLYR